MRNRSWGRGHRSSAMDGSSWSFVRILGLVMLRSRFQRSPYTGSHLYPCLSVNSFSPKTHS